MSWTAAAEALNEAVTETGVLAAMVSAAAWRAGVDPVAVHGITTAAVVMFADPADLLKGGLVPVPSDRELLTSAADLATDTGNHLHHTHSLSDQVADAAEAAARAAEAARQAQRDADTPPQARAAAADLRQALSALSDCERAMELLTDTGSRLDRALDGLSRVPDDLLTAYELPYEHLLAGRTLPVCGHFLTGHTAQALA